MPDMTPAPRRRPLWRLFIMPALLLVAAAATTSKAGMMNRRHSGRRRGAGVMSGMRRPLAGDFVKCKHLEFTTKGAEFASLRVAILIASFLV